MLLTNIASVLQPGFWRLNLVQFPDFCKVNNWKKANTTSDGKSSCDRHMVKRQSNQCLEIPVIRRNISSLIIRLDVWTISITRNCLGYTAIPSEKKNFGEKNQIKNPLPQNMVKFTISYSYWKLKQMILHLCFFKHLNVVDIAILPFLLDVQFDILSRYGVLLFPTWCPSKVHINFDSSIGKGNIHCFY